MYLFINNKTQVTEITFTKVSHIFQDYSNSMHVVFKTTKLNQNNFHAMREKKMKYYQPHWNLTSKMFGRLLTLRVTQGE